MVTVAAAAITGAAQLAIKQMSRVVVVGEYLIIELRIHIAIGTDTSLANISRKSTKQTQAPAEPEQDWVDMEDEGTGDKTLSFMMGMLLDLSQKCVLCGG